MTMGIDLGGPRTLALAAGLAIGAMALGACRGPRAPGGSGFSNDSFNFVSTTVQPMAVDIVDVRDGSIVWSYDIPAGKKLSIQFYRDGSGDTIENTDEIDLMRWEVLEIDEGRAQLANEVAVPPEHARRYDLRIRETSATGEPAPAALQDTRPAVDIAEPEGDAGGEADTGGDGG